MNMGTAIMQKWDKSVVELYERPALEWCNKTLIQNRALGLRPDEPF